jgi:hypothetical protein
MNENHTISLNITFLKYDQFEINVDKTSFQIADNPENIYYCYKGLAYKILNIGVRYKLGSTTDIKSKVFYSDFNLDFQKHHPTISLKEKFQIIITDEPLESQGYIIASL